MKLSELTAAACGAALVLACASVPALAIDPFFPTFGNNGIDVVHYDIDLDVDPVSGQIAGNTALIIRRMRRLASFTLDLHALNVSSVDSQWPVRRIQPGRRQADHHTAAAHSDGGVMLLDVAYGGVPDPLVDPTRTRRWPVSSAGSSMASATYVVSEPVGASSFFPANDEPDRQGDLHLQHHRARRLYRRCQRQSLWASKPVGTASAASRGRCCNR